MSFFLSIYIFYIDQQMMLGKLSYSHKHQKHNDTQRVLYTKPCLGGVAWSSTPSKSFLQTKNLIKLCFAYATLKLQQYFLLIMQQNIEMY